MKTYNTTSLQQPTRSIMVDRDYMAHVARWSYVVRLLEKRHWGPRAADRPFVIVDVGCGPLALLQAVITFSATLARGRPLRYYGVDVGAIRSMAPRKWAQFFPKTDALEWSTPELGDLVVCFEVIEHMDRPHGVRLLSALRSFVRPDGRVLLSTPVRDRRLPRNHIYEWGLNELLDACRAAGFEADRVWGQFMDVNVARRLVHRDPFFGNLWDQLADYHSTEVLSWMFSPLFPRDSKSVLLELTPDQAFKTSSTLLEPGDGSSTPGLAPHAR